MCSRNFIFLATLLTASVQLQAQSANHWNNKQCAVVLTYDDALHVHLDHAIPVLDSLGLKATFFLTCKAPAFTERIYGWKQVAAHGHELGNHTLFHPCYGNMPGREWVAKEYDLQYYSIRRMQDELRMTNTVLTAIDGQQQRTFAYPCGDLRVQDSLYLDTAEFVAARGVEPALISPKEKELFNLGSYVVNGQSGDELIKEVQQAQKTGKAIIFLFHGVGGEHELNVSLEAHSRLLHYLKANEKDIWVPTFMQLAKRMKKQ